MPGIRGWIRQARGYSGWLSVIVIGLAVVFPAVRTEGLGWMVIIVSGVVMIPIVASVADRLRRGEVPPVPDLR